MDLKKHHFIVLSISEPYSFDEAKWILGLGLQEMSKEIKQSRDPICMSNSLECLIEAAQQGKGIISAYDKMSIVSKANLQNILPDLIIKKRHEYFVYPEYLKEDKDIMDLKDYLRGRVGGEF